jgi:hypothetical protein
MRSVTRTGSGPGFRAILPSLIIDGLLPFVTYLLLTTYVPSISQVTALGLSAIFPAVNGIVTIVRRRHLDIIGTIVLISIVISIFATVLGGDAKLLLIRESFVTGALGVVCLSSFLWPRPLMFYIGRQFTAGDDQVKVAEFNTHWQSRGGRRTFRVLTAVWAVVWLGEFALRIVMVWTLSIPQVLAIAPLLLNGITVALIAWTIAYSRRRRQRGNRDVARSI